MKAVSHPTDRKKPMTLDQELERSAWMVDAACTGLDVSMFFLDRHTDTRPVRALCASCPVRTECAEYAIPNPDLHGIWGGLSYKQRLKERVRRRRDPLHDAVVAVTESVV